MSALLLSPVALRRRRDLIAADPGGDLARLADGLASELEPLLGREVWVPPEKARLTRRGGRCEVDGTLLEFDPWSPRRHRCATCGREYEGEEHYRWWIMSYQLWLAERAVHAAALHTVRGDPRHAALARDILGALANAYASWPDQDNVLGPTRPFFSTYLESIWLLQICVALDLLESASPDRALGGLVRSRLVAPSAALIASYDEGLSNRQVWNNAALISAALLMDDAALAARALGGPSGLEAHLARALLADGTWYEGENYHLFAHRGLWYGVTLAESVRWHLSRDALARFDEGFATPFLTALPDYTFPSRRDSQYAVSLRQWRFAELAELGLAHRDDPRLSLALSRLYEADIPRRDTGRARSTAEAERNIEPSALARTDLGWRSLLFAHASLPAPDQAKHATPSVLLDAQGYGVLRRDAGRLYVALDYGHSGAGHGHPDRLNVAICDGAARWADDPGTGSYVDPSLHWYRSTLAHDAPLVDGRSQRRVHGRLVAWEDRGGAGWVEARVDGLADGVTCRRTLVVMPDYVLDLVAWESARGAMTFDLPLHVDGTLLDARWMPAPLAGGDGVEDGFAFLERTERASCVGAARLRIHAPPAPRARPVDRAFDGPSGDADGAAREDAADLWVDPDGTVEWWRATAPGPPGAGARRFHLVRSRGERGRILSAWGLRASLVEVCRDEDRIVVRHADGTRHEHWRTDDGWHVELHANGARSSIDLGGVRSDGAIAPRTEDASPRAHVELDVARVPRADAGLAEATLARDALRFELGRPHWRGAEDSWAAAGSPTARVGLARVADRLVIDVAVAKRHPFFAPAREDNPLDNEHQDINSDGVQLHLAIPSPTATARPREYSWLLVPEPALGRVRVTPRLESAPPIPVHAAYRETPDGYAVCLTLPVGMAAVPPGTTVLCDIIINEMVATRERRRGQLVLSGTAPEERAYLLGDRHPVERFAHFVIDE